MDSEFDNYINYLDSISDLYPFGVPKSLLLEQKSFQFIRLINKDSKLEKTEQQLLNTIITKGFQFDLSAVDIVNLSSIQDFKLEDSLKFNLAIIFGNEFNSLIKTNEELVSFTETCYSLNNTKILNTFSLAELMKDKENKILLWKDIKTILEKLN